MINSGCALSNFSFLYCFYCILPWLAEMVKNLPAMRETWVQFLGGEDPLKNGMAIQSSILAWRNPWTEELSVKQTQVQCF